MVDEYRLLDNVRVRWNKLPMGVMKINLNKETKIMGVGVVIRDDNGAFVAAFSKIVPYILDLLTVEIVAVWHAAQLACDLGLQNVLLEGDSLNVIADLNEALV